MRTSRYLLLICFAISFQHLRGQQIPLYSNFYEMPQIQNVAYFGEDSVTTAGFIYRTQWSGINGAPESQLLVVEGRLPVDGLGVGMIVDNQTFNIMGRTSVYLGTSYGLNLNENHSLRFGMAVGLLQHRIDFGKVQNADLSDPALLSAGTRRSLLDGHASFLYSYKTTVEVGFTALQLFGNTAEFIDEGDEKNASYEQLQHYLISGKFYMPSTFFFDWELLAGFRAIQGLTTSWEVGAKMDWHQKFWTVALYRNFTGAVFGVGTQLSPALSFSYMYELPISGFGVLNTNGTHEVSISYSF
jgi:type IX secretion system PorP/SprF family membrane protein